MKTEGPAGFEVYCDRCRVSFPVGTRRCIHCGGRTSATRSHRGLRPQPADAPEILESEAEAEIDPEIVRRRFLSPVTLLWIVLIAAGYMYRACAGQSP